MRPTRAWATPAASVPAHVDQDGIDDLLLLSDTGTTLQAVLLDRTRPGAVTARAAS